MDPIAGPAAKVRRAATHLEALHREIGEFANSTPKPYRFASKVDKDSSRFIVRVAIDREPPTNLSLIAGDFIQNLRAALDHLIWQLVKANGERPYGRNAFPLFDRPPPADPNHADRERWDAMLRGVSREAIEFVEMRQPYHGESGADHHVLAALRRLSNEDKHRILLPVFIAIQAEAELIEVEITGVRDVEAVERGEVYVNRPLSHMDVAVAAQVRITGPDPEVTMRGELPLDIGFGKSRVPLAGLRRMVDAVAYTVADARGLFPT